MAPNPGVSPGGILGRHEQSRWIRLESGRSPLFVRLPGGADRRHIGRAAGGQRLGPGFGNASDHGLRLTRGRSPGKETENDEVDRESGRAVALSGSRVPASRGHVHG